MEQKADRACSIKATTETLYSPLQQSLYIFICLQYLWSTCRWCFLFPTCAAAAAGRHLCGVYRLFARRTPNWTNLVFQLRSWTLGGTEAVFPHSFHSQRLINLSVFLPNGLKNGPKVIQRECWMDWIDAFGGECVENHTSKHHIVASVYWTVYFHTQGKQEQKKKEPPHISNPKTQMTCTKQFPVLMPPSLVKG